MPNWKLALAFKDSKLGPPKRVRTGSTGSSSRSPSDCLSPEIIHEESEEELLALENDDDLKTEL